MITKVCQASLSRVHQEVRVFVRHCLALIDRCSNWIRVVWMEYWPHNGNHLLPQSSSIGGSPSTAANLHRRSGNSTFRSRQSPRESRSSSDSDVTLCTLSPRQHHGDCSHTPFDSDRRIDTPAGGCHRGGCVVWQAPAYLASVAGRRPDPEADPNWPFADVEIQ